MLKVKCKVLLYILKFFSFIYALFFYCLVALGTLLQTASDKNTYVIEAIHTSLLKIADNNTNEVLLACCAAADTVGEKNHDHLATILSAMERICEDHIEKIDGTSIGAIIQLTVRIMKQNNELDKIQLRTSNILVALGRKHCVLVSFIFSIYTTVGTVVVLNVLRFCGNSEQNKKGVKFIMIPYQEKIFWF